MSTGYVCFKGLNFELHYNVSVVLFVVVVLTHCKGTLGYRNCYIVGTFLKSGPKFLKLFKA